MHISLDQGEVQFQVFSSTLSNLRLIERCSRELRKSEGIRWDRESGLSEKNSAENRRWTMYKIVEVDI